MAKIRWLFLLVAVFVLIPVYACTETNDGSEKAVFKQQPEITEIRPQKPAKIKLKRGTTGQYSWDLSGDDADKILEADRKLREGLKD
ncbi:MAG TPA: hypothetical protein ENH45_05245 [Nitrospirae bacterium]|nr:hypothetical protein BMS3Abin09_00565 [bacterium BMS3Abin09]GBE40449.1 hypothetical protein BMS3Bbin09_00330 [bacterium BMS3Bbin09]HDN94627.1 hypothetical protein [Nitrospirota bacterium]HDO67066.1 hypothetical protein [Nitrospirota bacterium]HDZ84609.1 hypothetical protein [Nitrospirota bacterium]